MKILLKIRLFIFILVYTPSSFAAGDGPQGMTQLFKKLSDAGIDKIVELPYNKSLVANIGKQVKVHNIVEMQDSPMRRPEPKSLLEEFQDSFEYYNEREVLPSLTYKVGDGNCAYMEAIKVNDVLVCYRRASENFSMLAPVHKYGPRCTTASSSLSHCYIFAHNVDEVVRAIASNEESP